MRHLAIAALLALCACSQEEEECGCANEPHAATGLVAAWEPIDSSFAGCQEACGAHVEGPSDDVIAQPGASIGQRTYCPVSGAVFEITAERPHVDVDGQRLYFCCASCATYFEAHREQVLRARGMQLGSVNDGDGRGA